MRPISFIFFAVIIFASISFAGSLPRVGDTIDVAERAYFKLFPALPHFEYAVVNPSQYSGGEITYVYGDPQKTESAFYEGDRYNELARYLDKFEAVQRGKEPVDWVLLGWLVQPLVAKTENGSRVDVQEVDGSRTRGRLFNVSSIGLIMTQLKKPFDWRDSTTYTVFPADEISRVRVAGIDMGNAVWYGILFGGAAGAGIGAMLGADAFISAPLLGAAVFGGLGAAVGLVTGVLIGASNPPQNYKINGSAERLTEFQPRILRKAEMQLPPPEIELK